MLHVGDRVATPPVKRLKRAHFTAGLNFCSQPLCRGKVVIVKGILATIIAPDITLATETAGGACMTEVMDVWLLFVNRHAGSGQLISIGKGNGQVRQVPLQLKLLSSVLQRPGRCCLIIWCSVEGILLYIEHLLDFFIMRVKIGTRDGPVFIATLAGVLFDKPFLVFAQQDIRVDQRPAAKSTGNDGIHSRE